MPYIGVGLKCTIAQYAIEVYNYGLVESLCNHENHDAAVFLRFDLLHFQFQQLLILADLSLVTC